MKLNKWQKGLLVVLVVGVALVFGTTPASATHDPFTAVAGNGYEADQCHDFSKCGYNGPLVWNPYTIVASGIGWTTKHWDVPFLHGTRRGSELNQLDNIDAMCFNELISGNGRVNDGIVDPIYGGPYKAPYSAWPVPESEWVAMFTPPHSADIMTPCATPGSACDPAAVAAGKSYPNVLFSNEGTTNAQPYPDNYGVSANSAVNSQTGALNRCDRSSYKQLMYLGYNQRQGQYTNLPMRLRAPYDRNIAGSLVWDFTLPNAFSNAHGDVRVTAANAGQPCPQAVNCADPTVSKRDSETLSDPDAQANIGAFIDAGYSKGLGYNLYSLGLATTADGLLGQIGGHYGQSDNGFRKLNLFNEETGTWFPRPHPCNRRLWEADRYGVALGFKAIADATAGAGAGSGESLVNPPSMAQNGVASPDWPASLCVQHDSGWEGNPNVGDPSDPSDMRYWRWYPTGNMIPNGMVMTVGGADRDETAPACLYTDGPSCQGPPGPGNNSGSYSSGATGPWSNTTISNYNNREPGLNNSTIQVPVIDLWDPATDTQVALENARKVYPLYPMVAARETGPGWNDWEVCTVGGESAPASEAPLPRNDNLDEAQHWRDYCALPGCAADTRTIVKGAGGPGGAALDCLDILGAMADPNINVPGENHWTYSTRSHNRYPYSNPMIDQTIIGTNGQTTSHKLWVLGGTHPTGVADPYQGTTGRLIEVIELSDGNGGPAVSPTWSIWGRLIQTTSASHALALPDGNIFSSGGGGAGAANNRVNITTDDSTPAHAPVGPECGVTIGGPCTDSVSTYAKAVNLKNQILCIQPASYCSLGSGMPAPQKGRVQVVGQMTVPRAGIHGVYHLLNTGEALQSAYDRSAITRSGARMFTPGDADLAVNSSQIFTPPYLYDSSVPCPTSVGCKLATRPVIEKGPDYVHYGKNFELDVDDASAIKMVSMIRTGSATHTLAQDQTYVRVPFMIKKLGKSKDKGKDKDKDWDKIEVTTPTKPVQAKPGDWMVFIVNNAGTPSLAKHVRLGVDKNHKGDKGYVRVFGKFNQFPGTSKDKDKD
jgi:hypothetical protein